MSGPSPDLIYAGAEAICPATHRHAGRSTEPPCGQCWTAAETVLLAVWDRLHPPDEPGDDT